VRRSPALLLGVAGACVVLDQWTKRWASQALAFHEPVRVIDDIVRFTYTRNSGIAFGMFAGQSFPFYIFSIVASLAVVWLWSRHPRLPLPRQWSLALILGGAIGNLIDRVRHGEVVDFILLAWRGHEFPVFNLADVSVTCGVLLFAMVWTHEPHEAQPAATTPLDPLATAAGDGGESGVPPPAQATIAAARPLVPEGYGQDAGAGGAGRGSGSPLGPVAGQGPDHRPVA